MFAKYPGKLIVLEGIDGSGKTVQSELLKNRLMAEGFKVAVFDFPRYDHPASFFVRKYLQKPGFTKGYGLAGTIGPYAASAFYAVDRIDAAFCQEQRPNLWDFINDGFIVVSNRYAESNIGHQAAKIDKRKERIKFVEWLMKTEYELFKIPKPDLVIFFKIPPEVAFMLKQAQRRRENIAKDQHEKDKGHLERASWAYNEAVTMFSDYWKVVEIVDKKSKLLPPEKIHELVWQDVQKVLPKEAKK